MVLLVHLKGGPSRVRTLFEVEHSSRVKVFDISLAELAHLLASGSFCTFPLQTCALSVLFGGCEPDMATIGATECADDLSLDEEDESVGEEADKDGAPKAQAAGEITPMADAEEVPLADTDAGPEVRPSANPSQLNTCTEWCCVESRGRWWSWRLAEGGA